MNKPLGGWIIHLSEMLLGNREEVWRKPAFARQTDRWMWGGWEWDVRTFIRREDSRILILESQHSLGH